MGCCLGRHLVVHAAELHVGGGWRAWPRQSGDHDGRCCPHSAVTLSERRGGPPSTSGQSVHDRCDEEERGSQQHSGTGASQVLFVQRDEAHDDAAPGRERGSQGHLPILPAPGGQGLVRRPPLFPDDPSPSRRPVAAPLSRRYTTTEGITIPVTAGQREIALSNLEEQGLPRPMQYDDADVDPSQLAAPKPDQAAEAAAERAPGGYLLLRFLSGALLVGLSFYIALFVRPVGKGDSGVHHLDTTEGIGAVRTPPPPNHPCLPQPAPLRVRGRRLCPLLSARAGVAADLRAGDVRRNQCSPMVRRQRRVPRAALRSRCRRAAGRGPAVEDTPDLPVRRHGTAPV